MQFTYIKKDVFSIRAYMFKNGEITRLDTFTNDQLALAQDFVGTFSTAWNIEYKGILE